MQPRANQKNSFNRALIVASFLLFISAGSVRAQIQDRPKPGAEEKKLELWVGEWKYEGSVKDTPLGPGGKYAGKQTTRMIMDGLFQERRGEDKGVYGGKEMAYKWLSIQWFDPGSKSFRDHSYDNDGFANDGITTVTENTWTTNGTTVDKKGKSYRTRNFSTFASDGKTIVQKGDLSADDGKTWTPFWEGIMKKVSK